MTRNEEIEAIVTALEATLARLGEIKPLNHDQWVGPNTPIAFEPEPLRTELRNIYQFVERLRETLNTPESNPFTTEDDTILDFIK